MPLKIYKSSAGSGKTYTLVSEYVGLLIQDPRNFRHILAITFTNKATEEMKARIISALSKLADNQFDTLAERLVDYLPDSITANKRTTQTVAQRARIALSNILHSYSEFSVSTIDSFFQKIIRHNAKELHIPMSYEVEMDTDFAFDQIALHLFSDIGKILTLTNWLTDFTFDKIEDEKGWKIENDIKKLGKKIFEPEIWETILAINKSIATQENNENSTEITDETLEEHIAKQRFERLKSIQKELWQVKKSFEQHLKAYGEEGLELIAGYGLVIKDFKRGSANYFEELVKLDKVKSGKFELNATRSKIYGGKTSEWRTKKSTKAHKIDQLVENGLQAIFIESFDFYRQNLKNYISAKAVLSNLYVYGIFHDLIQKLRQYRTENSAMLVSDTNIFIDKAIQDGNAAFIFEKIGTLYQHLLLDEFQDTSTYQWRNLLILAKEVLSKELDKNKNGLVLTVGDVKQSIYRWRGGNMNLLLNGIKDDLDHYVSPDTEQDLATNYRSRKHIVDFNNFFFAQAVQVFKHHLPFDTQQVAQAYESVHQNIRHEQGGFVQIQFLGEDKTLGLSWKQQAEEQTITLINELNQNQTIPLRDMAILVRRNQDGVQLAECLTQAGIKVVSSESLLLNNSIKVRLLVSVLYYLVDKRNVIKKTELLHHFLLLHPELKTNNPHLLFADHLQEAEASLFQKILPSAFLEMLDDLPKKPLYELVETLIQLFDLQQLSDAYIQGFQDVILEQQSKLGSEIRPFLEWWNIHSESDKTSIIIPQGEAAVTIITIHKAKGLEFPIVLIPYCDWSLTPKAGSILWAKSDEEPYHEMGIIPLKISGQLAQSHFAETYEKEVLQTYLDNLNLLYVAFTRPVHQLYIFTKSYKTKKPNEELNYVHKLLHAIIFNLSETDDEQGYFDEGLNLYTKGQRDAFIETETSDLVENLTTYLSNDYQKKIRIRSDADRFFLLFDKEQATAIRMGQKIHAVLEKMIKAEDLDRVIQLLQTKGILQTADIEEVRQRIRQIFMLPKVQTWFEEGWEVLAERPLLRAKNSYIPDRVLLQGRKAVIIDYKTGKEEQKHEKQIRRYANILASMGYEVIEKALLYIGESAVSIKPVK